MPRSISRNIFLTCAAALISWLTFVSAAPANAEGTGFMASPTKLEVKAQPGEESHKTVAVTSLADAPIQITTGVSDYTISQNNAFTFSAAGHTSYSAAKWIKVKPEHFTLGPKETKEVDITVEVPAELEPGGHYAAVLFQTASQTSDKQAPHLNIVSRLAVLMLASSGSQEQILREGEILGFTATNSSFSRQVNSELLFKNQGNVHLTLKGDVVFTDMFGRRAGSVKLTDITALPDTRRVMKSKWNGPAFGRFSAVATVQYGPDLFTFDTKKVSKEVVIWIVPWKSALAVMGALVLAALLILRIAARRKVGGNSVQSES